MLKLIVVRARAAMAREKTDLGGETHRCCAEYPGFSVVPPRLLFN
jgi:hypothetical protein